MGETINIIAHQWRQPISLISNHLNSIQLKMEYKKDYTEKEILDSIKNAQDGLQYISSTITLFQSYLKPREVSLNETFEINYFRQIQNKNKKRDPSIYQNQRKSRVFYTSFNGFIK